MLGTKGSDAMHGGQVDKLATSRGNTGLYIHTHTQQVKVIRAGTDNQGGGRHHTSREGGSETKGEVNTPKYNRDISIN